VLTLPPRMLCEPRRAELHLGVAAGHRLARVYVVEREEELAEDASWEIGMAEISASRREPSEDCELSLSATPRRSSPNRYSDPEEHVSDPGHERDQDTRQAL